MATASNSYNAGYGPAGAINGDRKSLNWTNGGGWNDSGPPFPDYLEVDFGSVKTVNEIHVFTLQDNYANSAEPTESMTFTLWGLTAFALEYWNGSSWVAIPGASVSGNNKIWRQFTFTPINTSKIRVQTTASVDGYSRITEVEAYGPAESSGAGSVRWLITDHLGTPRMVLDQSGSLANIKRHDYLPFGEELVAPISGRSAAQGYASGDGVRQQFTLKERDTETSLDYFKARYYSSTQGRFTSVDPEGAGARESDPQSWNGYAYAGGNPVLFSDPDGREYLVCDPNGKNCTIVSDEYFWEERRTLKETGNVYTGSGNWWEAGQIRNADGEVVATYVQFSIDDLSYARIAAISAAVDPIPMATVQFFGLSVIIGSGGGVVGYFAPSAVPFLAPAAGRLSVTGPSVGLTLMNQAQNPRLRIIIDSLYRVTARIGSGSTADVIRYERSTGKLLSKAGHSIKGRESIRALESLIKKGDLSAEEVKVARFLINDLKDALATPTNPLSIR